MGNVLTVTQGRFISDIRKKFFSMKAVRHWHRFPSKAVDDPSLEVIKIRMD